MLRVLLCTVYSFPLLSEYNQIRNTHRGYSVDAIWDCIWWGIPEKAQTIFFLACMNEFSLILELNVCKHSQLIKNGFSECSVLCKQIEVMSNNSRSRVPYWAPTIHAVHCMQMLGRAVFTCFRIINGVNGSFQCNTTTNVVHHQLVHGD